jgi:homer protein
LYKDENAKIKVKYADLEAGKIAEGNSEALRLRVEALESELRTRNEEIKALTMATKSKDFVVHIRSFFDSIQYLLLIFCHAFD